MVDNKHKETWDELIEGYWSNFDKDANPYAMQFMEKMRDQGAIMFKMADGVVQGLSKNDDWSNVLDQAFSQFQSNFSAGPGAANWQDAMAGGVTAIPDMFAKAESIKTAQRNSEQWISAMSNYHKALAAYNAFFSDFSSTVLSKVKKAVKSKFSTDESIDSARSLYDLWIVSAEETYSDLVSDSSYIQLHGDLVNSSMKVQQLSAKQLDDWLDTMKIPSQARIRELQSRLQESRREVHNLKADVKKLQEQMTSLLSRT